MEEWRRYEHEEPTEAADASDHPRVGGVPREAQLSEGCARSRIRITSLEAGSPMGLLTLRVGRPREVGAFSRAGDRGRTGDVQLGKLIDEGPEDYDPWA